MTEEQEKSGYMGIGVVAENAILGHEELLHVAPQDQLPNMRGRLELNPQKFTTKGVDSRGKAYQSKVETGSTVTAKWLNEDSNRITPPQLMKGETVHLYRFNGDETFYWKPTNQHMNKRVQEVVVEAYAAKPKEAAKEETPTNIKNSYTRTVDTANGLMEMRTSKANGEKAAWTVQMNGKDGKLVISDGDGNFIQIDSTLTCIDIQNKDRTHIQLDKQVINIQSDKTINMKTETWNVECKTFNLKADNVKWEVGSKVEIKCPTIDLIGQVNMGGMAVTGNGGSGNGSVKGNMDVSGSQSIKGSLSASGPVDFPSGGESGHIRGSGD